jgi:hypothetical protein
MDAAFPHPEIRLHWRRKQGMKIYGWIIWAALAGAALAIWAQDAAPPSVDLYSQQQQSEAVLSSSPAPNGPELPEISQLDQTFSKPRSMGKDADELRLHLEWRQLKNRTVNDPQVQAAKAYAQAARTDLEMRNRLRNYYDIYYQRMSALATTPEIKLALQAFKAAHQSLLNQPRVRPSPTPEGFTPTPTPSGTPAKKPAHPGHKHKKKAKKSFLGYHLASPRAMRYC